MSCRTSRIPLSLCALVVIALAGAAAGCGKANPVAPSGSTITLSANPSAITSSTGTSTITAVVRKPNGTVAAGVDVRFTASLGTIDTLVRTDSGGVATATLKGDGRSGTAMVNAAVDGGGTAMALSVPIGGGAKTITLQALPASIAVPGTTTLVALVRDAVGSPASGVLVNFTTNLGTLTDKNGKAQTNAQTGSDGTASLILNVSPNDVSNQTSVMVTATAAASDGSLQTANFTVSLLTSAATAITVSVNPGTITAGAASATITLTAIVQNSLGNPVAGANVIFTADRGTLSKTGIVQTGADGSVTDTLTVAPVPSAGSGVTAINVTATVTAAGGTQLKATAQIAITTGGG